ncbi:inositol monophosphatase family protein [Streptomyces hygroscopicus]|uniref:inositol monophosphatase family protein n=1 Tax=Streptomyces hygroscopicus TaxID=1912 RepID=UPI000767AF37|nr:inositol monophosphatase family protein [Streptomyces hygroscopicus]
MRWPGRTSVRCAPDTPRAAGRLDGSYEADLRPWDHAAGALIAQEAGAWVAGAPGAQPGGALTLACAPALADGLRALVGAE